MRANLVTPGAYHDLYDGDDFANTISGFISAMSLRRRINLNNSRKMNPGLIV